MTGGQWPMPRRRRGHTTAVTIGSERFYLTANQRDDGSLGEVFMHWGKHGTSGAGLVNTYAIALSIGLRHLVPLADLIRPGLGQYFAPNGLTDDPEIPVVSSAVDYVARRLAIDWLPYSERTVLGVYTGLMTDTGSPRDSHTVWAWLKPGTTRSPTFTPRPSTR